MARRRSYLVALRCGAALRRAMENLCDDNREFRLEKSVGEPRCDTRAKAQLPLRFQSERRFERSSARHNQPHEVVRVDTNAAVEASGQKPRDRALTGALRAVNEEDRSLRSSSQRKSKLYAIELKSYVFPHPARATGN